MSPGKLEQHQRAVGIDGEIHHGIAGSPVMGGLGGGMDDDGDILAIALEDLGHRIAVANVGIEMDVVLDRPLELLAMPLSARLRPEEHAPHVIVDAGDIEALVGEEADRLAADQPRRAGNNRNAHPVISLR